ncbi:MAG: glycosyltransferase [Deltaproteobacteria bacterium]|nr:glycosyltransferase [Deltaproteobacteria bacterium]
MAHAAAVALLALGSLGTLLLLAQLLSLRRHLAVPAPRREGPRTFSILKPLCGLDDDLAANLESFAALEAPAYEVLLGVRSTADTAFPLAMALARRDPRFRVVVQRGAAGANPKVNQLVTLAAEARNAVLVVSDSNVRVAPGYLREISALLADPEVGLVTHLVAGAGERRLGSLLDHLHLTGFVAPALVGAKRLAGRDIVVGKSMAFRREDLEALGGFAAARDFLAEDYVLGTLVSRKLGKRVALAHRPVVQVSHSRGVADFLGRYARWAVLHRTTTGRTVHLAQAMLNPVLLAAAALVLDPGPETALGLAGACLAKAALEGAAGRLLRPGGFAPWQLLLVPVKDLLLAWPWAQALWESEVSWRGNRLRVHEGTRVEPAADEAPWTAAGPRAA